MSIRYAPSTPGGDQRELTNLLFANQWVRVFLLTLYYVLIVVGLILLYGRGDFSTPSFIYQGF